MPKPLLLLFATFMGTLAHAGSAQPDIIQLPMNGMSAAAQDGKFILISTNGRFIVKGTLYDSWSRKHINSIEDARYAKNHINLDNIKKFDVDDLAPITVGSGEREVIIFVDPRCPHCHRIINQAMGIDGYRFKIVPIPMLGNESAKDMRALHCAKDPAAAKGALMNHQPAQSLPQSRPCDPTPLQKRLVTAQVFGLTAVPTLIRDDGKVSAGVPSMGLEQWLNTRYGEKQ